ncbi:hypothetical protein [Lysobacter sp. A378]
MRYSTDEQTRRSRWRRWTIDRLDSLRRRITRAAQVLPSASPHWRDAAWGVIGVGIVVLVVFVVPLSLGTSATDWRALLYIASLVAVPVLVALALLLSARLLLALPALYRRSFVVVVIAAVPLFDFYATRRGAIMGAIVVVLAASLFASGLGAIVRQRTVRTARRGKVVAFAAAIAGLAFFAFAAWWLLTPGKPAQGRTITAWAAGAESLDAPDPSLHGPHRVVTWTYGSGTDRYRPEFAADVDVKTRSVDGSKLVSWSGTPARIRAAYWGFDTDALPLQGRVWQPDGNGPFPLVLAVHGNHLMEDFSDAGYAYLGEQMASRGFIFVSVDQNFLNTGIADLPTGTADENDARGWLLLEHLRLWHEWNADPDRLFFRKVDTTRIGLVGHSRGGEAVAIAAAFNHLPLYPDDATLSFDYGYDIRAVAAIAPVDGQYRPARVGTPLRDVHYFTMQGGHDADQTSFEGIKQFDRVAFSDDFDGFKSALHVAGANHGQFNTDWGRLDITAPFGWLLNVRPLIPAQEQRRVTQVYLGAFMEATLRGDARYVPLFQEPRLGADWLPENAYAAEFVATGEVVVASFAEDLDLSTATLPCAVISQTGLSDWREQRIGMRHGQRDTSAVYLGWSTTGPSAHYAITLPDAAIDGEMEALAFSMADTGQGAATPDDDDAVDDPSGVDLTVRLTDAAGNTAELTLGSQAMLIPAEHPDLFKSALVRARVDPEPAFQTYVFPLDDFVAVNPDFDRDGVLEIAFVFDRTREGTVALSRVAFVPE